MLLYGKVQCPLIRFPMSPYSPFFFLAIPGTYDSSLDTFMLLEQNHAARLDIFIKET